MKSKKFWTFLTVALASLSVVTVVFAAYSGATGTVVDTKTGQPWSYGATAFLLDTTSMSTCYGEAAENTTTGVFTVSYGSDTVADGYTCTTAAPANGTGITVLIKFAAGPNGTPPDNTDCSYTQSGFLSGNYNCSYIYTHTGPTAVVLDALTANPARSPYMVLGLAIGALALISGAIAVSRKRSWG